MKIVHKVHKRCAKSAKNKIKINKNKNAKSATNY